jgi:hypothetical protein
VLVSGQLSVVSCTNNKPGGGEMGIAAEQHRATALGMRIPIPVTMGDQFDVKIGPSTDYLFSLSTPTTFVFESIDEAMAFHQRFGKAVMEYMRADNAAAASLEASPDDRRPADVGPRNLAEATKLTEAVVDRIESWRDRQIREGPMI